MWAPSPLINTNRWYNAQCNVLLFLQPCGCVTYIVCLHTISVCLCSGYILIYDLLQNLLFHPDSISQRAQLFHTGGGFTCSLSDQEPVRFLQFLKQSQGSNVSIRRATTIVGKQADGKTWVLNPNLYVNSNGKAVEPSLSSYIWSPSA